MNSCIDCHDGYVCEFCKKVKTNINSKLISLMIDVSKYDVFDIGEILQSLPEDTEIVDINKNWFRLEHSSFKIVAEAALIPTIKVNEDVDGKLSTTLSNEHLDEGYVLSEDGQIKSVEQVNKLLAEASSANIASDTIFQYENEVVYWKGNYPNSFISESITSMLYPINVTDSFIKAPDVVFSDKNKECQHQWKEYVGFTDSYSFCSLCDIKKEL